MSARPRSSSWALVAGAIVAAGLLLWRVVEQRRARAHDNGATHAEKADAGARDDDVDAALSPLARRREAAYASLGQLDEQILSRLAPAIYEREDGGRTPSLWPASVLGALRIVQTKTATVLVTDGLSDPWDTSMWGAERASAPPLDTELALELVPRAPSASAVPRAGWAEYLLYRLADQLAVDAQDLAPIVARFGAMTYVIEGPPELDAFGNGDGTVGLVIAPLRDDAGAAIEIVDGSRRVHVLEVTVLRHDEYAWAIADGNDTAKRLLHALGPRRVHAVASWNAREPAAPLDRPSALLAAQRGSAL